MVKRIRIEMPPFGKARPRVTRGGTHTYMPKEYEAKRAMLRMLYRAAGGKFDVEGPLKLSVEFFFKMPKSWSKKKRKKMLWKPCLKTPDIDNLVGAVMDALIEKDQKVAIIWGAKWWYEEDRIEIGLERL